MSKPRRREVRSALDLIEEAVHLLRGAPAGILAAYLTGTLPFLLGLLYFWSDMSRSPDARQHAAAGGLGVALSFLWMKFWQAEFARRMRAWAAAEECEPLGWRRAGAVLIVQTALQPIGLFLLPVAAVTILGFAWVYTFFQGVTVLGADEPAGVRALAGRAARQAGLWPGQSATLILCLGPFVLVVLLNLCIAGGLWPSLVKTLFGIETVFSRSGLALLNSTFFATALALAYLAVDPLLKTVFLLRSFYADAVHSGADLRADLRHVARRLAAPATSLLVGWMILVTTPLPAAETRTPPPAPAGHGIAPDDLNRAIEHTIQQRKFVWRLPREAGSDEAAGKGGALVEFLKSVGDLLVDALKKVGEGLEKVFGWIEHMVRKLFGGGPGWKGSGGSFNIRAVIEALSYLLVVVLLGVVVYQVIRWRRERGPKLDPLQTEALQPVPDLTDENVGADQLPEDGWAELARELLSRGEFRLAMRAFYLSSLAHLADRNLISLARFKSNRDYERELNRRAHALAELCRSFGENITVFDRIWYGTHEVTDDLVARFAANVERIKAGA